MSAVFECDTSQQASIIGTSWSASLTNAAFVNGVSAHALEYDDNMPDVGHVSACMVPACLAFAENGGISGLQVVEAFALGYEVAARISVGLKPAMFDRGWHSPGMIGGLGATVAGCRLLGLDVMATRMAMGIMASSGTGIRKNVGSAGKAFHIGNGTRAGVTAALLARKGFLVDPDIIEGGTGVGHQRFGLAETYSGAGGYSLSRMVEGLGGELFLTRVATMVRMHPGSSVSGAAIEGIIELANTNALHVDDVEHIEVECHPQMLQIASYTDPSDTYRAKFCPPYTFAVAFLDRKVGVEQYSEGRIKDSKVLEFMRRVTVTPRSDVKHDRGWNHGEGSWGSVKVGIVLRNGSVLKGTYSHALGWPGSPASWKDLQGKYRDCAAGVISGDDIEKSMDLIDRLDTLPTLRHLIDSVTLG
jgi:2-methylcitrate dehydratase PrpD